MQETIRSIRDRTREELGALKRETFEIHYYGSLEDEIDRLNSNYEAIITEWKEARKACKEQFHKIPSKKRDNGACPDCGIEIYENLLKPF